MSEAGGPVMEGFGKPESVGDRVRRGVKERFDDFQNKGVFVEKKWMDSYQRVVDATDPGLRKKALEMVRPVAWGVAKVNRIGTAVIDVALRLDSWRNMLGGIFKLATPGFSRQSAVDGIARREEKGWRVRKGLRDFSEKSNKEVRMYGVKQGALGIVENVTSRLSIARRASVFMADILGAGGEKVAQITNKILRGKPKAVAA